MKNKRENTVRYIEDAHSIVNTIRKRYKLGPEKGLEYGALRRWPDIVGQHLAAHTTPLYIVDKCLYVKTEGAVWMQEVSFKRTEIINRLNDILGVKAVTEIRYKSK